MGAGRCRNAERKSCCYCISSSTSLLLSSSSLSYLLFTLSLSDVELVVRADNIDVFLCYISFYYYYCYGFLWCWCLFCLYLLLPTLCLFTCFCYLLRFACYFTLFTLANCSVKWRDRANNLFFASLRSRRYSRQTPYYVSTISPYSTPAIYSSLKSLSTSSVNSSSLSLVKLVSDEASLNARSTSSSSSPKPCYSNYCKRLPALARRCRAARSSASYILFYTFTYKRKGKAKYTQNKQKIAYVWACKQSSRQN